MTPDTIFTSIWADVVFCPVAATAAMLEVYNVAAV